jgi:D-3-phosphoglycerate dehydrogenase
MNRPVVAYSERLNPLSSHEQRLADEGNVALRVTPLWTEEQIREHGSDADIVIIGSVEPMGAESLETLTACRLVIRRGIGLDNVDVEAATRLGIPVAYVPDASVEEVSDHALALLLALERRVVMLDRFVMAGRWTRTTSEIAAERSGMRRLRTLTLGILGLGRIGRALASKSSGIFDRILGHDPFIEGESVENVEMVTFDKLLEGSDLISLHVPLTDQTTKIIDRSALEKMRDGAYIVNTSRGGLIDEDALIAAIQTGAIAGAALDVTAQEPLPEQHPLLDAKSIILTGHSAASGVAASDQMRQATVDAALAAIRGFRPSSIANPDVFAQENCRLAINADGRT